MNKTYKRILLISIIGFGLFFMMPVRMLVIKDGDGLVVLRQKVTVGQEMVYTSIHSVSMTPLEETLTIGDQGGFDAVKVRFKDQSGAGLPEMNYGEAEFYTRDGWMVIEGMDRHYDRLSFRINERYDNRLYIDDSQILLYEMVTGGVGELNLSQVFRPRCLLWLKAVS